MVKEENEVLICKCKKTEVQTEKGGVFEECICNKPNAKEWKYKRLILQTE